MFTGKTKRGVDLASTVGMPRKTDTTVWMVVAHRSGAQIFEKTNGSLRLLHEIANPAGRRKAREEVSDRQGRSFERVARAAGGTKKSPRHPYAPETSLEDKATRTLANKTGKWLEAKRKKQAFSRLVLVAEPQVIGVLKQNLAPHTRRRVEETFEKDLAWLSGAALKRKLMTLAG